MPLPDPPFWITTEDAVATLWLDCETLTPARLTEIASAAEAVSIRSAVDILLLRTANGSGFPTFDFDSLKQLQSDTDAAEYARIGQQALRRLANVSIPTVAVLEGRCVGPGLELALACDHRLAVATPDAVLSFGDWPTTWGGRARLAKWIGRRHAAGFTACYPREAAKLGLVDDAFCARRAKIDRRTFLDRLQQNPVKRGVPTDEIAEAEERTRFRAAVREGLEFPEELPLCDVVNPIPSSPRRVGIIGAGNSVIRWIGEYALRGIPVTWVRLAGRADVNPFAEALARGRVTPLEVEQARKLLTIVTQPDDAIAADLVIIDTTDDSGVALLEKVMASRSLLLVPRADLDWVLPASVKPGRVLGWESVSGRTQLVTHPESTADSLVLVTRWLGIVGERIVVHQMEPMPRHRVIRPLQPLVRAS